MTSENSWNTTVLRAGAFRLDGGSMFGVVPKPIWSKWSAPDEANRIRLDCNCALLRDGERCVLVETGFGEKWTQKDREIFAMEERTVLDALHELDVAADAITHVVVSHLHFDHAGALTSWTDSARGDESGFSPSFPNAEIIVQQREWDDALANRSTMTRTYLRSHLDPVADRVRLVQGEAEPLPGIRVAPVPGHTWGQHAIYWSDTGRDYVFPGDLCPTRAHAHPAANMAYDVEPWTNMRQKAGFLRECADTGRLILLDHDPEQPLVGASESAERPGRYRLESAQTI